MTPKTFDAVKLMRDLRDKLSQDMESMTPEERFRFIRDKAACIAIGRRTAQDAAAAVRQTEAGEHPPTSR